MKRINFETLRERNDYQIDYFLGGYNMEFIKHGDNYLIKNSNGRIVSEKEKLKLERNEMVIKDFESNNCQKETTKKLKKINKKIKKADAKKIDAEAIEETSKSI